MNRARKASEPRPQVVTVVDLEKLIGKYGDYMSATPFNVGNAMRKAAIRGKSTFVKLEDWKRSRWKSEMVGLGLKRERGRGGKVVEVTLDCSVPDIGEFVVASVELERGEGFRAEMVDLDLKEVISF